ncbi:hypothetical protein HTZ77_39330 [Nonomuraea sp. SMC257]|uniref:Uncharacterized protein n=1 Tax=Nonomuraea montanisoli TaxID=2741721 RepID=A0A7Y6M8A6_9ACTN|nr:hypothetical protein [Nonomuraea montanisoli]NUW37411.1 hypothetical protein [Nonomuraea montanisoli]
MSKDQVFRERARVLDTDLSGSATTAGADALLTEIFQVERTPAPVVRRTRRVPAPSRLLLGLAASVVLAGAFVVGPSLFKESGQVYASQAVTIDRDGDEYVFYITDGDPDPAELQKAFQKVGLDNVKVELIPVSPRQREPVVGWEASDPGSRMSSTTSDCKVRVEGCLTAFNVTADLKGPAKLQLGRPAKPGEKYAYPIDATVSGEAMAGTTIGGLTVAEAVRVVREHDLKVTYQLRWPLHEGVGYRAEEQVPASRVDPGWKVAEAESYNDGAIVLSVEPGPGATPPPGY